MKRKKKVLLKFSSGFVYFLLLTGALAIIALGVQQYTRYRSKANLPTGKSFFVSTSGKSIANGGTGTAENPWDLKTALLHPPAVQPGDTIWVKAGTYAGTYSLKLKGTVTAPITVRNYNNERVTLDNNSYVMDVCDAHYVNVWGLEITDSRNQRTLPVSESSYGLRVNQGCSSSHVNLINMVVHDVQAQGFALWSTLTNSETYGNLIYYNGVTQLEHGIYTTNNTGTKRYIDNFIFNNAAYGLHAYSENLNKYLDNFHIEGNIIFNNSSIGYNTSSNTYGVYKGNIIVGGKINRPAANLKLLSNYTYYPGTAGRSLSLGYSDGTVNAEVANNYFVGGEIGFVGPQTNLKFTGNTIVASRLTGLTQSQYPTNTWSSSLPSTAQVFIRPNAYETNRFHVAVYNSGKASTISLTPEMLAKTNITAGDRYEFRNVEDFYNAEKYVTGTYSGNGITLPMTGYTVAQPVGISFKPASTLPSFGGFVLYVYKSSSTAPSATPVATLVPTATPRPSATPASTPLPTSAPTPTVTPNPSPSAQSAAALNPTDDAYVVASEAKRNYGRSSQLQSDGSGVKIAYLKFNLATVTKPTSKAILKIYVSASSGSESKGLQIVRVVNPNWVERTISYNSRPSILSTASSFTGGDRGQLVEIDVTEEVNANLGKPLSFSISSTDSDGIDFDSKEVSGSTKPTLELSY